jgi:hypothetical protein
MKQTAVEWLANELSFIDWEDPWYRDMLYQAKQKEKEQLIGLLEWMNKVTAESPMRLETDNEDIVEQYLETLKK